MKKVLLVLAAVAIGLAVLLTGSFATATNNLWRCMRCNGQMQTSDTSQPKAGSCPRGGGHDWILVR